MWFGLGEFPLLISSRWSLERQASWFDLCSGMDRRTPYMCQQQHVRQPAFLPLNASMHECKDSLDISAFNNPVKALYETHVIMEDANLIAHLYSAGAHLNQKWGLLGCQPRYQEVSSILLIWYISSIFSPLNGFQNVFLLTSYIILPLMNAQISSSCALRLVNMRI